MKELFCHEQKVTADLTAVDRFYTILLLKLVFESKGKRRDKIYAMQRQRAWEDAASSGVARNFRKGRRGA